MEIHLLRVLAVRIGVPKEIKNNEYRVGLVPAAVGELVSHGHQVIVETSAGAGIGYTDAIYQQLGASIAKDAKSVFDGSELIIKVKEPQASERQLLSTEHTLFTYLHLAPDLDQTRDLIESGATCIAYETVTDRSGRLPLLAPMSEVAGRMSIQAGAMCLEKAHGGKGVLLGGVPGVKQGQVLVLGAGVVGSNAVQIAVGMGARVTVIDRSAEALTRMDQIYGNRIQTLYSTQNVIESTAREADLIIGAVLVPGASAPKLVSADLVRSLEPGSVLVDVAIDQGGCFETSHPTTHDDPIFIYEEVVHYCVANMPGAVAHTSTTALNNVTLPYILELANKGIEVALRSNRHLLQGLNVYRGKITNRQVSEAHGLEHSDPQQLLIA